MAASQMWVIGNANVDLTSYLPTLPEPGQTVLCDDFTIGMGGKGANQAVAASRAGGTVAFVGRVGTDSFGTTVLDTLGQEAMDISHLTVVEGQTGVANIYVDRTGANQIAVFLGASAHLTPEAARTSLASITGEDYLVSQLEIDQNTVLEALRTARKAGATTVLNTAPYAPLGPGIIENTTWLIANEVEIRDLLRHTGLSEQTNSPDLEAIPGQINSWAESLGCNVVITVGEHGAIGCVAGEEPFRFAPKHVDAVDTVGAGDCFVGFFTAFLQQGLPWRNALAGGVLAASESVQKLGAQVSYPEGDAAHALLDTAKRLST